MTRVHLDLITTLCLIVGVEEWREVEYNAPGEISRFPKIGGEGVVFRSFSYNN